MPTNLFEELVESESRVTSRLREWTSEWRSSPAESRSASLLDLLLASQAGIRAGDLVANMWSAIQTGIRQGAAGAAVRHRVTLCRDVIQLTREACEFILGVALNEPEAATAWGADSYDRVVLELRRIGSTLASTLEEAEALNARLNREWGPPDPERWKQGRAEHEAGQGMNFEELMTRLRLPGK